MSIMAYVHTSLSLIIALGAALLQLPFSVQATENHFACPNEIPRQSIAIVRAPEGWAPFMPFKFSTGLPPVC